MKIAILDDYQDSVRRLACFSMLDGHDVKVFTNPARGVGQLAIRLAPFDVIVVIGNRTRLSVPLLFRLTRLKLIVQTGKRGNEIDIEAATQRGIAVVSGAIDPAAVAELTWALIMAVRRQLLPYAVNLREGLWQTASTHPGRNTLGIVMKGKTLGVWGYGRVGSLLAGYGRAFGMRVLVWGSEHSRMRAQRDGHASAASRLALFEEADVLSVHLQLSDATRGIVTSGELSAMKPEALFVNTAHAGLIAPGALLEALQHGRPGYAALDVFDTEPLPPDAPLLQLPNVLATPHIGDVEHHSYEERFRAAFQSILDFASGLRSGD
jgi:D-3-phosphoglycerate dehydrogenase